MFLDNALLAPLNLHFTDSFIEVYFILYNLQNSPVPTSLIKLIGFDRVEDLGPGKETVITMSMVPSQMTVSVFYISNIGESV